MPVLTSGQPPLLIAMQEDESWLNKKAKVSSGQAGAESSDTAPPGPQQTDLGIKVSEHDLMSWFQHLLLQHGSATS